jgi:CubicO group peptidase (beta-lactamase class C family)
MDFPLVKTIGIKVARCVSRLLACLMMCVTADADDFTDALREVLGNHIDLEKVSGGIVVGIVDENGPRVASYGRMAQGNSPEVNGDTLFEIGSITKTFTALLLQDMVERRQMKLDDPVANYLPSAVKVPAHGGKEITLLHLVTHTSGLPRDDVTWVPRNFARSYSDYTVDQLHAFLSGHTLIRDPGAKHEYSNFGAGLLGHVIALKANASYESLVVDRICKPLAMDSTCIGLSDKLRPRSAIGHDWFGNPADEMVIETLAGNGGMHSTANDMLKYLGANLGLTQSALTPLMEKTHATRFKTHASDGAENQAMGWVSAGDLIWHTGGTYGSAAFAGFNKKQRRGLVVLTNSAVGRGVYPLVNLLLNTEWRIGKRPQAGVVDQQIYDSYVGQYQLMPNSVVSVRHEGNRLLAEVNGQIPLELLPETATVFFVKLTGKTVKFVPDAQGRIKGLHSDLNGNATDFTRISDTSPARPSPSPAPTFVNVDAPVLDTFAGRYELPSGQVFNLKRRDDHLIMLPERRCGLELYPESAVKASCPYFHFGVTLLKNDNGEIIGLTVSCPEPEFNGNALKAGSRSAPEFKHNFNGIVAILAAVGGLLLVATMREKRKRRRSTNS